MAEMAVFVDNTNVVHFENAYTINLSTGEPEWLNYDIPNTFRVQDASYVDVPGETWPLSLSYVPNTQGHHISQMAYTVDLNPLQQYRFVADIDVGSGAVAHWDMPLRVLTRHA